MSAFLYPNSATRKMYGQAGRVLQRQARTYQDRLNAIQAAERKKRAEEKRKAERENELVMQKYNTFKKRVVIVGIMIAVVTLLLLLIL